MSSLRKWLFPFAPLYGVIVWLRNKCYDWGLFAQAEFEVPVLCIGNLSVGGTGKTPMTEWLLDYFAGKKKVAVLSRGYGRKTQGFRWVRPEDTALDVGDEPLQIARKFPGITVAVDGNRRRGIAQLISKHTPDLILLDDAFQHRRVLPKISLLLTTWDSPYSEQGYLPFGDLRDHKSQVRRADAVVVTKCPELPDLKTAQQYRKRLGLAQAMPLAFATLSYGQITDNQGNLVKLEVLKDKDLTLVTGIARPEPLLNHLREIDLDFTHRRFGDHHVFTDKEINEIRTAGNVLTTAKDATRLGRYLDAYYVIPVAHDFGKDYRNVLEEVLKGLWT
ncbi:lipid-A-disaccharide kinase [Robiginitalea myxolifaciens]|uniref:Tetraacyldisaccharide 4'-kinase n=1 Tax=Robiginitalea myxolifaciens TaxID=400055 RepID=A0A1I6FPL1_9FLAO|nr:tetraacyldisaccharide 4'-kinase [Robiginitalea myxolifaciens]SFR31879.1 lipid-A-disaccharide kinase [Robiginitalea myxolifaciens]